MANKAENVSVICGDHDRAVQLCELLENEGLSAVIGDFSGSVDVILFDLSSCKPVLVDDTVSNVLLSAQDRPLLASLGQYQTEDHIPEAIDVRLSTDAAIKLGPARFHLARRVQNRSDEAKLRLSTFERFGHADNDCSTPNDMHPILYVGDAGPTFLSLKQAIDQAELDMIAAFSIHSAFDYLHDAKFSAIALDTHSTSVKADVFCDMISRSPGLADIPLMALIEDIDNLLAPIQERAADVMMRTTSPAFIISQIQHLATYYQDHRPVCSPREATFTDTDTGLFDRSFFESHLEAQINWARQKRQPVSMIVARVIGAGTPQAPTTEALRQAAQIIQSLLRAQDTPSRLSADKFAITLPGSNAEEARAAASRISAVLDATAYETGSNCPDRQVLLNCRILELSDDMSACQFLKAALSLHTQTDVFAA